MTRYGNKLYWMHGTTICYFNGSWYSHIYRNVHDGVMLTFDTGVLELKVVISISRIVGNKTLICCARIAKKNETKPFIPRL